MCDTAERRGWGAVPGADFHARQGSAEKRNGVGDIDICCEISGPASLPEKALDRRVKRVAGAVGKSCDLGIGAAEFTDGADTEAAAPRLGSGTRREGDESTLHLELDWRLAQRAPRGLGIFVHVEGTPGDESVIVDHALVSSTVPLEDAPVGVTLRDISFPIALPKSSVPRTWKVHAGLWFARRDGQRMPVVDAGRAHVEDDRVLVGTVRTP